MEVVVRYRYDRKEGEEKREKRNGKTEGEKGGRKEGNDGGLERKMI